MLNVTAEEGLAIVKKILIKEDENKIRLSEFTVKANILEKNEEKKLISLAIQLLSNLVQKSYSDNEFDDFLLQLSYINAFKNKYFLNNEFYAFAETIVEALNFNSK